MYDINSHPYQPPPDLINKSAGVVPNPEIDLGYAKLAEERQQRHEAEQQRNEEHLHAEMVNKLSKFKDGAVRDADKPDIANAMKDYSAFVHDKYAGAKNGKLSIDDELALSQKLNGVNDLIDQSSKALITQAAQEKDLNAMKLNPLQGGAYNEDDLQKSFNMPLSQMEGGNPINYSPIPKLNRQARFNKTMVPLMVQSGDVKPEDTTIDAYGNMTIKNTAQINPEAQKGILAKFEQDPAVHSDLVKEFAFDKDGFLAGKYPDENYKENPMQKYSDRLNESIQFPLPRTKETVKGQPSVSSQGGTTANNKVEVTTHETDDGTQANAIFSKPKTVTTPDGQAMQINSFTSEHNPDGSLRSVTVKSEDNAKKVDAFDKTYRKSKSDALAEIAVLDAVLSAGKDKDGSPLSDDKKQRYNQVKKGLEDGLKNIEEKNTVFRYAHPTTYTYSGDKVADGENVIANTTNTSGKMLTTKPSEKVVLVKGESKKSSVPDNSGKVKRYNPQTGKIE